MESEWDRIQMVGSKSDPNGPIQIGSKWDRFTLLRGAYTGFDAELFAITRGQSHWILRTFSSALANLLSHFQSNPLNFCSLIDSLPHLWFSSLQCQLRLFSFLDHLLSAPFWIRSRTFARDFSGIWSKQITFERDHVWIRITDQMGSNPSGPK